MTEICPYISYAEATKSQEAIRAGVDNTPNEAQLVAMRLVGNKCFVPLRKWHGKPIGITSFVRSPWVNKKVGGSKTSSHMTGEAMDIDADMFNNGITNAQIYQWLADNVVYDQLIWEFGDDTNPAWVHVSHRAGTNRMQALRAVRTPLPNGTFKTDYITLFP